MRFRLKSYTKLDALSPSFKMSCLTMCSSFVMAIVTRLSLSPVTEIWFRRSVSTIACDAKERKKQEQNTEPELLKTKSWNRDNSFYCLVEWVLEPIRDTDFI